MQDSPETSQAIVDQVSLLTTPDLATGLLSALMQSRQDAVGDQIMARWTEFTPNVRRTAISVLMRRSTWTKAMLDAVDQKEIPKADLAPEHWTQLQRNPDRQVARTAERLATMTASSSEERKGVLDKLLPLANEQGDAARGKEVFATSCVVCHVINGEGGKVGPELTGIGARDRTEILQEILDPNRSLEANYRLWIVTTNEDAVFAGRLEAETQTTVKILDLVAQKHIIQRSDIKSLQVSPQSIMPAGFDALPAEDLKNLLEYLAQSKG
ncbi:MAG: c-type cytochrome [Verrucomicrobia bacterium]|nr:c-type cytochrome [Verrucomicrobiota bacterium]